MHVHTNEPVSKYHGNDILPDLILSSTIQLTDAIPTHTNSRSENFEKVTGDEKFFKSFYHMEFKPNYTESVW